MKYCLIGLLFLFLVYSPINAFAGTLEDYEEARKIHIAAGASVAAYEGRIGDLAARYLEQAGWQVDHYIQAEGRSGARFIVAKKIHPDTFPVYIVAIVGTENGKDVKIDLKIDKVYFAGSNFGEFTSNAAKKDVPDTEPKVHKGFNEFVQAGPAAVLQNPHNVRLSLPDLLRADNKSKVYLVGHSLGGAAAILTGARLISMGIDPAQIEVITFGAPAVGNAARQF
ncbi:MAG: lipase class 3 [Firmicutes bacterium]|nr:lipase class 3 [Bacillota bacterium]